MPSLISLAYPASLGNATTERIRAKKSAGEVRNLLKRGPDKQLSTIEMEDGRTLYLHPDHVVSVIDLPA